MNLIPAAISEKGLIGLSKYKYSAVDLVLKITFNPKSPISNYILQPYWTLVAAQFPVWMAPNLITFLGFLFVLCDFFLLLVYTNDFATSAPSWVYASFAAGLWLYSTFDNVDGKQARRTGTSSPLGELFDHGVDALNCTLGGLLQAAGVGFGLSLSSVGVVAVATVAFYFATWDTFYTGTMYLGHINGPTEGLLISLATLIISAIYGPQFWRQPLVPTLISFETTLFMPEHLSSFISKLELGQAALWSMVLCLVFIQLPTSISRVLQTCWTRKMNPFYPLLNVCGFLCLFGCAMAWVMHPTSVIMSTPTTFIMFLLSYGIAVGKVNALIILNHVTHQEYPSYVEVFIPFAIGAALSWAPSIFKFAAIFKPELEAQFIVAVFVWLVGNYALWVVKVIDQLCTHLKIRCFTIPVAVVDTTSRANTTPSPKRKGKRKGVETPTLMRRQTRSATRKIQT